jgi:hypothetical protein
LTDAVEGLFDFGMEVLAEGERIGRENEQGKIERSPINSRESERGAACRSLLTADKNSVPCLVTPDLRDLIPVSFNSPATQG